MKATEMIDQATARPRASSPRRDRQATGEQGGAAKLSRLYDEWEEWTTGEMRTCAHRLGIANAEGMNRAQLGQALRERGCTPG